MMHIGNSLLYMGSGGEGRVRGPTSAALTMDRFLYWQERHSPAKEWRL